MITACVLTLSDKGSRGLRKDTSGPEAVAFLEGMGAEVKHYEILPDEKEIIKEKLIEYSKEVDLVVTTGGTGLAPRDVAPEATLEVIEKEVPGIPEAMRSEAMKSTPRAMLSRAVAGIRGQALIINLPGSPKAVREGLEAVGEALFHAVEKIKGDTGDCA